MKALSKLEHVRLQLLAGTVLLVAVSFACSSESNGGPPPDAPPADDAGADVAAADAAPDADCPSCRWYPSECSAGALCAADVAIEPKVLLAAGAHAGTMTVVGTYGAVLDHVGGEWRDDSVGTNDALRSIQSHGDELWVAGSLDAIFIRSHMDGGAAWARYSIREGGAMFFHNVPVNGLFADPARTWAWLAVTPMCAGGFFGDGVALVRVRREGETFTGESIVRHDGFMSKCAGLNAITGSGGAIWAVGDLGAVYELTDVDSASPKVGAWSSGTTESLLSVWADTTGQIWAAGKGGTLVRRAPGGSFTRDEIPTTAALHGVHGTSASDVWAVGADATALHFDGKSWSRVPIAGLGDRRPTLHAVAALGPDRVWVAGDGVLLTLAGAP